MPPSKKKVSEAEEKRLTEIRAAMMADIGTMVLEGLPLADGSDREGRPGRHGSSRQGPSRGGHTRGGPSRRDPLHQSGFHRADPTQHHQNTPVANQWNTAINSGAFDDEDAHGVKHLSNLGGGRLYATSHNDTMSELNRAVPKGNNTHHDPMSPYGQACLPEQSRVDHGQSTHRPPHPNDRQSSLGIVVMPDMPVRTFVPTANRESQQKSVQKKGNSTPTLIPTTSPQPPVLRAGLPMPQASANLTGTRPQCATVRFNRTPDVKSVSSGSLFDRKRQNAIFNVRVQYYKACGAKFAWAMVLLTPAHAEESCKGHLIIFIEKGKDNWTLEQSIILDIVTLTVNGAQALVHVKENEACQSSHKLIFQTSSVAQNFRASFNHLTGAASPSSPTAEDHMTMVNEEATDQRVTTPGGSHEGPPLSGVPVHATVANVEDSTANSATETGNIDDFEAMSKEVPLTTVTATTSLNNTATPSFAIGNGRHAQTTTAMVMSMPDFLTGDDEPCNFEVSRFDSVAPATSAAAPNVTLLNWDTNNTTGNPPGATMVSNTDVLRDLDASLWQSEGQARQQDEAGYIQRAEQEYQSSRVSLIDEDIPREDARVKAQVMSPDDDKVRQDDVVTDGHTTQENAAAMMLESLEKTVSTYLPGYGSNAEDNNMLKRVKEMIAEISRTYMVPDPMYFAVLTEQQKLAVIDKFLGTGVVNSAEDVLTQVTEGPSSTRDINEVALQAVEMETLEDDSSTKTGLEVTLPQVTDEPTATSAPAANSSPYVFRHIQYSTSELLDARGNAVEPPDSIRSVGIPVRENHALARQTPRTIPKLSSSTPSESPTAARSLAIMPLKRDDSLTRPAAPPTPDASPMPTVAKLGLKLAKLTLEDGPVAPLSPLVQTQVPAMLTVDPVIEKPAVLVPAPAPPSKTTEHDAPPNRALEAAPRRPLAPERPIYQVPRLRSNGGRPSDSQGPAQRAGNAQPLGPKDNETKKREMKEKVHLAATLSAAVQQRQNGSARVSTDAENSRTAVIVSPPQTNSHPNGAAHQQAGPCATAPYGMEQRRPNGTAQGVTNVEDTRVAAIAPAANANGRVNGVTDRNAGSSAARPPGGLTNSRWATRARTTVVQPGNFTGVGFKAGR